MSNKVTSDIITKDQMHWSGLTVGELQELYKFCDWERSIDFDPPLLWQFRLAESRTLWDNFIRMMNSKYADQA